MFDVSIHSCASDSGHVAAECCGMIVVVSDTGEGDFDIEGGTPLFDTMSVPRSWECPVIRRWDGPVRRDATRNKPYRLCGEAGIDAQVNAVVLLRIASSDGCRYISTDPDYRVVTQAMSSMPRYVYTRTMVWKRRR